MRVSFNFEDQKVLIGRDPDAAAQYTTHARVRNVSLEWR